MRERAAAKNSFATRWEGRSAVALTAGGLGVAFAAATCCALPILLGGMGLGTAWLFGIGTRVAPHRLGLLVIALALLAAGAWTLWRQGRTACAQGWCSRRSARLLTAAGLLLGVVLAVLGYHYG